jgi:hypothetical protein
MAKHLCHEAFPGKFGVRLVQTGFDRFTVEYGLSVKRNLTYGQAAAEYGACIMHALACDGHLDNRTRSEARKAGDSAPFYDAKVAP